MNHRPDLTRRRLLRAGVVAGDNREWAPDDPDSAATTELVLEAWETDGEPTAPYLPLSEMPENPGAHELVGGQGYPRAARALPVAERADLRPAVDGVVDEAPVV